ncbi:MAG TPA: hypothetical protein VFM74_07590 [Candidatus Limnocylindria bacterium]|nr:hypothetical protein [Candidatus Limnocylindria bacterium]
MKRFGAAGIGLLLVACSSAPAASPPAATTPTPRASQAAAGLELQPLEDGTPLERPEAGIGMAFDDSGAVAMIEPPPQIDYSERAVVCVYLGRRTGRWTLDLQSATLDGKTLEIAARERPPRQPTGDATLPAACATISRTALPTGQLKVTAHDTVSDEFITEGSVEVPPVAGGS